MPPPRPKAADDKEMTIEIVVDDRTYVFYPGRLSARDVGLCRRSTGFSIGALLEVLNSNELDIDIVAALVWLARRQDGERELAYGAVADSITYDSKFGKPNVETDIEPGPDAGEAPAADTGGTSPS